MQLSVDRQTDRQTDRQLDGSLLWVDLIVHNDRFILVILNLTMDGFFQLHDNVNVASDELGDGLTLGGLHRVEGLRIVPKVLEEREGGKEGGEGGRRGVGGKKGRRRGREERSGREEGKEEREGGKERKG